jgi:hypothetical protein
MSDPENFLTRWSRRKLEAEEKGPTEQAEPAPAAVPEPPTQAAAEDDKPAVAHASESETPAVDLSTLTSIEEITAETDIRAFLQPGIPLQLTRAALRRVWTADPAIRDFVGLAENAWDFTAPDGVPGFGPLTPNDIARQAAQLAWHAPATESLPPRPAVTEPLQNREVSAPRDAPRVPAAAEETPASDAAPEQDKQSDNDAAMQKEQAAVDPKTSVAARHGGALPR